MPDAELGARLRDIDCASLADANKAIRVMDPGLRPVATGHKLVGVARTVRCHEDFLAVIAALDAASAGEVLVVDTQQSPRAVVGELFSMEAARRELAGIVVDGLVRDIRTIAGLPMPVWARGYCPCAGTTQAPGEVQVTVQCGGVEVNPGDILIGDDDGIVVASVAELEAILPQAETVQSTETEIRRRINAGENLVGMLNFREHYQARLDDADSALGFRLGHDPGG